MAALALEPDDSREGWERMDQRHFWSTVYTNRKDSRQTLPSTAVFTKELCCIICIITRLFKKKKEYNWELGMKTRTFVMLHLKLFIRLVEDVDSPDGTRK